MFWRREGGGPAREPAVVDWLLGAAHAQNGKGGRPDMGGGGAGAASALCRRSVTGGTGSGRGERPGFG